MLTAIIVYASLTGNTEEIAFLLAGYLRDLKVKVNLYECTRIKTSKFRRADLCIIATYTYGSDGDLPYEIEDLYFDLEGMDLSGKTYAVIGSGEKIYDFYCKSVDDFDRQLEKTGAKKGAESIKIESRATTEDKEKLQQMAIRLIDFHHVNA